MQLPTLPLAKAGNMRHMMAAMPGIHAQQMPEGMLLLRGRMHIGSLPLLRRYRFQQHVHALVQSMQQGQRIVNGQLRIGHVYPVVFFVGFYGGVVFAEGELHAAQRIDVAIAYMVHYLMHRPAAIAVRGMQLRCIEVFDGRLQQVGQLGNINEPLTKLCLRKSLWRILADGITWVHGVNVREGWENM